MTAPTREQILMAKDALEIIQEQYYIPYFDIEKQISPENFIKLFETIRDVIDQALRDT